MGSGLKASLLLCLAALSAGSVHRHDDESALVQKELQLHRFLDSGSKARLLQRLREDPTMREFLVNYADVQKKIHEFLMQRATNQVVAGLTNSSAVVSLYQQLPGAMPSMPGMGGGGSMTMGADQMKMMEEMLDALSSDDFLRNYTKMQGDLVDLMSWFNTTASGHMDMFVDTTRNSTTHEFVIEATQFMNRFQNMELDLMVSALALQADLTHHMPKNVFKDKDYGSQADDAVGNITMVVDAMKNMTRPNMTNVDGQVYCPFMISLKDIQPQLEKGLTEIQTAIKGAKKMLPMVGRMFGSIMPEDDVEAQEMTPRLLFMLGLSMNTSEAVMNDMAYFQLQFTGKFAPLVREKLACVEEASQGDHSGAVHTHSGIATALLSAAVVLLSLRH